MAPRSSGSRLPRRILIVEDYEDTRVLLAEHFTQAGYDVETAADGNEAVAAALRTRPDVIVLDLAMPVLDGVGALAILQSYPTMTNTPVIICTGNPEALKRRVLRYDAVVQKPCVPDELERVIDDVLEHVPQSDTA
jgi:CheY-like chemotaxis protein